MLWKLPLSGHSAHGLICCRLGSVANDPEPNMSVAHLATFEPKPLWFRQLRQLIQTAPAEAPPRPVALDFQRD
jgi:hypothetical protein